MPSNQNCTEADSYGNAHCTCRTSRRHHCALAEHRYVHVDHAGVGCVAVLPDIGIHTMRSLRRSGAGRVTRSSGTCAFLVTHRGRGVIDRQKLHVASTFVTEARPASFALSCLGVGG